MCKSAMKGTVDKLTKINSRMKIIVCHWNVFIYFFTFNSIDDIAKYFNCKLLNINMYDKILLKHFFLCVAIVLEWSLLYPRLQYYGRLHKWQELQEMDLRTNQNGARGSEYWSCERIPELPRLHGLRHNLLLSRRKTHV